MSLPLVLNVPIPDFSSDSIASRQCSYCVELFLKIPVNEFWDKEIEFHSDLASLEISTSTGCSLCSAIIDLVPKELEVPADIKLHIKFRKLEISRLPGHGSLHVVCNGKEVR